MNRRLEFIDSYLPQMQNQKACVFIVTFVRIAVFVHVRAPVLNVSEALLLKKTALLESWKSSQL